MISSLLFLFLIPTFCIFILFKSHYTSSSSSSSQNPILRTPINPNATTLYDPEDIVNSFRLKVKESVFRHESNQRWRRVLLGGTCSTGNPIDDCWRCDPNWASNRQKLADCGIGFGKDALGGRNGRIYVVTDSSDGDAVNPKPGTLRHAAIQTEPLWITFRSDMTIKLKEELLLNSFKTIDGRGSHVHITGGCITIQYVSNIIIHGVLVHDCVPVGNANVRSTPDHFGWRGVSDGDGISIFQGTHIWVDHVAMVRCRDGLIDAIMGSTAITISNSYFAEHNEVMLMGHSDDYSPDSSMQVTIAFNRFGEKLVQRMPRCRLGYFHIANNDYTEWEMYAIGGSANPTINSQGNRYRAPADPNAREVTKRVDSEEKDWVHWNWRTEGDQMVNGAFFLPSGVGLSSKYEKASSLDPKSAGLIDQLTINTGVLGYSPSTSTSSGNGGGGGGGYNTGEGSVAARNGGGGGAYMGMTFSDGAGRRSLSPPDYYTMVTALYLCLHLYNIMISR